MLDPNSALTNRLRAGMSVIAEIKASGKRKFEAKSDEHMGRLEKEQLQPLIRTLASPGKGSKHKMETVETVSRFRAREQLSAKAQGVNERAAHRSKHSPQVTFAFSRFNLSRFVASLNHNAYVGTFGVFLGAGIATLNGRMISVGLPDLRGAMGFGFDEASWIPTAYNMALMFIGRFSVFVGAMLGARRVLLYAGIFSCSVRSCCHSRRTFAVMLCLQVISGLSSGTFYPLALSYALLALPVRYVIYAIGVYAMDIVGALSVGTPLVAWYTEHLSWHWIFWQSVFLTLPMMLCVYLAIPHPPKRQGPRPALSWRGFLYGSLGLSLIYGALDQGERLDWLNSGVIVGLLVTAAFLLGVTIIRRWFSPNPMVNPIFLVNRNTMILAASLFSFRFAMLAIAFLLPAALGVTQQYRPLETGQRVALANRAAHYHGLCRRSFDAPVR